MHEITVRPCDGAEGWMLELPAVQPQLFRSGAAAETSARALARRLADSGRPARLTVLLRDGAVAGRVLAT